MSAEPVPITSDAASAPSPSTTAQPGAVDWAAACFASTGALALYLALLPRVPGIGDSAEFTLALAQNGVAHPTGYPFYVLAGHAWVTLLHALGIGWVTAANAWSALGAAVAVGLYAAILERFAAPVLGFAPRAARAAAIAGAAVFALNPLWISLATVAEVHSWEIAWLAGAALFTLERATAFAADSAGARGSAPGTALGWGLLCGLGVAHHALSVFFIVPFSAVLAVAAVRAGAWRPWLALLAALGIIVPLAGGALLLAGAAHPVAGQWPLAPTVNAVWRHMTGMAYRGYVGRFAPRPFERRLIVEAVIPFLVPGIAGGALFALRLGDFARRSCMLALLGGAALLVAFVVNYGVPDPSSYFAAPLLAALIFVLPLFAALARRLSRTAWLIVLCGAPLALGAWSIPDAIRADRELDRIDRRIRDAWHRVPFERGIVMWSDDHFRRLVLFQALEGDRPGPIVVDPVLLTWPVERARFERAAGFNPLMGLPLSRSQDLTRIPGNIRRLSPLPVADFPDLLERRDVTAVSGAAPSRPSP